MMKKCLLGHRGYCELAPENTYLSFKLAYFFGFDGVELDVHQTKDRKLVVIHDETIERTTNSKGKIQDLTLKELEQFNFGAKFKSANIPFQKILTYEEFLEEFGNKFCFINVEVKTNVIHYPNIEKRILNVTQKIKPHALIIYSSFNLKSLEILRNLSKEALIGFLFLNAQELKEVATRVKATCNYLHPWFKSLLNKKQRTYFDTFELPFNT